MAVTWPGDLHMDTPAALPTSLPLDIKSLETTVIELPQKCTSSASSSPSVSPSSSPKMEPKVKRIDPPPTRSHSHSHSPPTTTTATTSTTTTRPRTNSRPTSATGSAQHSRSNSRSNPRSRPPSRHGSLHSSRRAVTTATASIVPVPPTHTSPHERRESLLALHRESCRLFQDLDSTSVPVPVPVSAVASAEDIRSVPSLSRAPSSTYTSRREGRSSSETGHSLSSPPSPVVSSQSSHRFDFDHRNSISSIMTPGSGSGPGPVPLNARDRSNTLPNKTPEYESFQNPSASSIHVHVPATVTEWTSPSSRRAEYEKIDRAGRGVRGLWRRVAPRWCQSRDARTPFFEEGITSSSREGSVRRFRMDLPDEELDGGHGNDDDHVGPLEKSQTQMLDFLGASKNLESGPRRWTYRRTKTSPA